MTESANWVVYVEGALLGILIYSFGYHRTSTLLNDIVRDINWPSAEQEMGE